MDRYACTQRFGPDLRPFPTDLWCSMFPKRRARWMPGRLRRRANQSRQRACTDRLGERPLYPSLRSDSRANRRIAGRNSTRRSGLRNCCSNYTGAEECLDCRWLVSPFVATAGTLVAVGPMFEMGKQRPSLGRHQTSALGQNRRPPVSAWASAQRQFRTFTGHSGTAEVDPKPPSTSVSPGYAAAGFVNWSARCATAPVAAVEGSPSPAICTVGNANLMPLASNAILIMARAFRRITNCSPGKVIIFDPDLHREIAERVDALHLQRLDDERREFGVLSQFQPYLLDQFSGTLDIAVIGDADRQLVDDPVAALVLDGAQQAERHGVDRTAVMPQPDRAKAEGFDGALVVAALDVLADPEGVVEEIEHAGDDVANERLGAEADRDAEDAQTGDQRSDLDTHCRERHYRRKYDDYDEQHIAEDGKERMKARPPSRLIGIRLTEVLDLGELAIDCRLRRMPQDVGDEEQ